MISMKETLGRAGLIGSALSGLFMVGFVLAGAASATPADPAGTAISDLGDKVSTYGAAIVAVVVIAAGLMLGIKYLRKAVSKA